MHLADFRDEDDNGNGIWFGVWWQWEELGGYLFSTFQLAILLLRKCSIQQKRGNETESKTKADRSDRIKSDSVEL